MRSLLAIVLVLSLCGSARADVFVPADPPPLGKLRCAAGADGVLAAVDDHAELRVRFGNGPWTAVDGLSGCPTVAGAADGTAAITGEDVPAGDAALRVRAPGGAIGPRIALGRAYQEPSVAVAPGGWAAAAWVERATTLVAVVVRPDGSTVRSELDRGNLESRSPALLSVPLIAIDASGDTTVVWKHSTISTTRVRVARGAAGGAPVIGRDIASDAVDAEPSLTVAPSGTEVITWITADAVFVSVDGQVPQRFQGSAARSVVAVADGGGPIVLAYTTGANEIVTVERAGPTWSQPRVIAAVADRRSGAYPQDERDLAVVGTVVAPDGRATVLWARPDEGTYRLYGALGRVGGTWGTPQRLSAITRTAFSAGLWLDATGATHVLWTEEGVGLRGATVAARPIDTTAPDVTARLPTRVPPTRTGRFTVRVRVRCSEACDAQLAFPAVSEYGPLEVTRRVAAGQSRELRLGATRDLAKELLRDPKARRVRLRLVVTDRAGNLVRRTGALRVRVIEKPIRSLKVARDHDFKMKTAAGNRLVASLVNDIIDVAAGGRPTERALQARWARGRRQIRRAGHREIGSDRVYREIYETLVVPLTRAGYDVDMILAT